MTQLAIIFGIILLVLAVYLRDILIRRRFGRLGEAEVERRLATLSGRFICYSDVRVGASQLDHVVLSRRGIYVLEVKNYSGRVVGRESDREWLHSRDGKHRSFQSPIAQNETHIRAISRAMGLEREALISVIVFAGGARLKIKQPLFNRKAFIVTPGRLCRLIRRKRSRVKLSLHDAQRLFEASAQ